MREAMRRCGPPVVLAAVVAGCYLAAGAAIFPMDDAWIHAVYARNLAAHGLLSFNLNPADAGLGTTSVLWPLLLAALHPVLGVVAAARVLGVLSYLVVVALATLLARSMLPDESPRGAWLAGALVALSGNLAWFGLSGMETMLWLAFGLGAVVAYQHNRAGLLGVLLGLMLLTRIEGVALLGALWLVDLRAHRRLRRELVVATAVALLLLVPWLAYVHHRTGHWLPTSYSGKKHAQIRGAVQTARNLLGERRSMGLDENHLPWWTALLYPLGSFGYALGFVAGAAYLPGPKFPFPGDIGDRIGGLAVAGFLALFVIFPRVWWPALQRAGAALQRADTAPRRRALAVLAVWFVLHNLAYWIKLPTPGTASRYQVVNHLTWWLLAGVGGWRLGARGRPWLTLVVVLAVANCGWWWTVYAADVRHMVQVRLAAADWIRGHTPPDAKIAGHDIGALGWSMDRRCLDLGGLIDPGWLEAARAGRQAAWLRQQGASYVVLPTKHSTETTAFFDYAEFLGVGHNPEFRLVPVQTFENDYADWLRSAMSTWNAAPAVTIYRIEWSVP